MNTKCKVLVMLFLFTMVCASDVFAQLTKTKFEIESLRGIKGVDVAIEDLNPDIEKDGLKKDQIQTDVELKLRLAGIKVLTEEERLNEPGMPFFYVNVNSQKSDTSFGFYSFNVDVRLCQWTSLIRDPKILVPSTTWSITTIGHAVKENGFNYVRDVIKDQVDKFINDYLSVNPK